MLWTQQCGSLRIIWNKSLKIKHQIYHFRGIKFNIKMLEEIALSWSCLKELSDDGILFTKKNKNL